MSGRTSRRPKDDLTPTQRAVLDHMGLVTDVDVAAIFKWTIGSLTSLRSRGLTPRFVRVGKSVCFHKDEIAEWVKERNALTEGEAEGDHEGEADEVTEALDKHLLGRKPKHAIAAE